MTYHFRGETRSDIWNEMVWLAHRAYADEEGEVLLTGVTCASCNEDFETTLEDALDRVSVKRPLLCLSCDDKGGKIRNIRKVLFTFEIV